MVEFTGSKHYVSATATSASSCKPGKAKVTAIAKGKAHPYHLIAVSGAGSTVYGWTDAADIKTDAATTAASYLVKVTTDVLNIRKGPGTNYGTNGAIRDKGTYTIVAESDRARGLQVGQAQERGRLDLAGLRQEGLIVQLATGAARIGAGRKL